MKWLQTKGRIFILALHCAFMVSVAQAGNPPDDKIKRAVEKLNSLVSQNEANTARGESYRNNYIFGVDEGCENIIIQGEFLESGKVDKIGREQLAGLNNELAELASLQNIHFYIALVDEQLAIESDPSKLTENKLTATREKIRQFLSAIYDHPDCAIRTRGEGKNALLGITPVHLIVASPKGVEHDQLLKTIYLRTTKEGTAFQSLFEIIAAKYQTSLTAIRYESGILPALRAHKDLYVKVMKNYDVEVNDLPLTDGPGKAFYEHRKDRAAVSNEELKSIGLLINTLHAELYQEFVNNGFAGLSSDAFMFYELGAFDTKSDYEKFKAALKQFSDNKQKIEEKFIAVVNNDQSTPDEMLRALSYLSFRHCRTLSAEMRLRTLRLLSSGTLTGNWFISNGSEFAVIKLIRTTPKEQIGDLFNGLRKDNLLIALNDKIDNFFGPENYTTLMNELHTLFRVKDVSVSLADLVNQEKVLRWTTLDLALVQKNDYDDYFVNGYLYIQLNTTNYTKPFPYPTSTMPISQGVDLNGEIKIRQEYMLDPFEPIALLVENEEAARIIPGAIKGETYVIPACYFAWIRNEYKNGQIKEGLTNAITVGGLLLGFGEVVMAKNTLQLTIALVDVGFTLGDVLLSDEVRRKLGGMEGGQRFLQYWDVMSVVSGLTVVSPLVIDAGKGFVRQWDELKLSVPGDVDPATIRQIESKVEQVRGELNKIDGVWDDVVNVGSNLTTVKKITGKASVDIPWKNLDDKNIIWPDPNNNKLYTAKVFADETGSSLYDAVLDGGYYVKFDLNDGKILLGNTSGAYHAFGVIDGGDLNAFKSGIRTIASDAEFNTKLSAYLTGHAEKLKVLSGQAVKPPPAIGGRPAELSATKVNTILGRYRPDLQAIFNELGSYKNVGLGEKAGGINLLNKPDHYLDASWWESFNQRWLEAAVKRGDDVHLATIPQKWDEIVDAAGNLRHTYARELDYLASANYKPKNLSDDEWLKIKSWLADGRQIRNITKDIPSAQLGSLVSDLEDAAFRSAIAGKPELVDAWKALDNIGVDDVIRRNPNYLKNIDDYAKRSGKNADEVANLAKNNENGIEQFLDELEDTPSSGHWDKNPFQRGKDIEDDLGQNLPETFKTIDKYDFGGSGKATSIKSLDLDAKTYQDATKLRLRLNRYVDQLDVFTGHTQEGINIGGLDNPILLKELELVIPRAATGEQLNVINAVIANASGRGINVNVVVLP